MIRLARLAAPVGVAALLGALFWLSASWAGTPPGTQTMEIDVHGLGIGRYDGRSVYRPAPLSQRIVTDARHDAAPSSLAPPTPTTPAAAPTPAARPSTPASSTSPALPVPSPTVPAILPSSTAPSLPVTTGSVQGSVTDTVTGSGILGATVTLTPAGPAAVTDGQGRFVLPVVVAGPYTLTVSALGYQTQSQPVTVLAGQTLPVDVRLARVVI